MKYIKIFEVYNLYQTLEDYGIRNYTINNDKSIDVDGNVHINTYNLKAIPFKFNYISGNFDCSQNELESLEGCPIEVGGYFSCAENKISSLKDCPIEIGGDLYCNLNNLTKLDTVANVEGDIICGHNNINPNNNGFMGFCGGKVKYTS